MVFGDDMAGPACDDLGDGAEDEAMVSQKLAGTMCEYSYSLDIADGLSLQYICRSGVLSEVDVNMESW